MSFAACYTIGDMASLGVYVFKRKGNIAYVGRSDSDVMKRMPRSFRQGAYDRTVTLYPTTSPRQAYLLECHFFHRHNPSDNDIHPAVRAGANWRCPVNGCPWS